MLNLDNDECLILLQLLLRQSITGYALVGEDGRFWYANNRFCQLVEYTESELKGKKFRDITDPEDIQADEEMAKMVATGDYETYDMIKSYITKTKRNLPVLLRVTGLRKRGKFICFASEIAPLDRPQAIDDAGVVGKARHRVFLRTIKDWWPQIVFGMTLVGGILAIKSGIKVSP